MAKLKFTYHFESYSSNNHLQIVPPALQGNLHKSSQNTFGLIYGNQAGRDVAVVGNI